LIGAKLVALLIGLAFRGVGIWFMRYGHSITTALNRDYARLPFHFQYPSRFHRFFGWHIVCFGVLFALTGVLFAKGFPR